jgi:hypothetical protein
VLVRPAYTTWKPGNTGVIRVDATTGEVMCLVEVPAEYKTAGRKVERTPAARKTVDVPAEYAQVDKSVLKTSARTVVTEIPAEYEMREVTKRVEPAKEVRAPVPSIYDEVPLKVLTSEASHGWRSVLCERNATEAKLSEIQRALKSRGFCLDKVDGKLSLRTMSAADAFEKAN